MSGKCAICDSSIDESVSFDNRYNPIQLDPCHTCQSIIMDTAGVKVDDDEVETVDSDFDELLNIWEKLSAYTSRARRVEDN